MFRILILFCLGINISYSQVRTATIRGTVRDVDTNMPLQGATITLNESAKATTTNLEGSFRFDNQPVGRYFLTVSYLGYETITVPELFLESGRENVQDISLSKSALELSAATVSASRLPAVNSIQEITSEQTLRYAATYLDPARVATSFAGVAAANDQANGLVIRGNSPNSMQWRLEGMEIVNPNHLSNAGTFSDRATTTGGGVNILSTQLMGKSYFMTGATPAQYGNALSGVLDMYLRKGNNEKTEFTAQAGLIGVDFAAEGPFSKNSKASYLVNYRYSFTGILGAMGVSFGGEDSRFQDLAFNINLPTENAGTFTFFGMAGISSNTFKTERDTTLWEFQKDENDIYFKNKMGAIGLTHTLNLGKNTSLTTRAIASGLSTSRNEFGLKPTDFSRISEESIVLSKSRVSLNSYLNIRLNPRFKLKTGAYLTFQSDKLSEGSNSSDQILNLPVEGAVFEPFASLNIQISDKLAAEAGLHYLHYSETNSNALEPRLSLKLQANQLNQFSVAYGLQSQLQTGQIYNAYRKGADAAGCNCSPLDISKSHQVVVGYQHNTLSNSLFKLEAYWQHLFNIPIATVSNSFSALNAFENVPAMLMNNTGTGRNIGIEATFQKYLTKELYYLISGSLYQSTYKGSDQIERSTRFDGRHTFSFTGGKEFGKKENSTWGINAKLLWVGGFRDTPIDQNASFSQNSTVYLENQAYSIKLKDYFRPDLRVYWKKSKPTYSRTWSLDLQNVSSTKNEAYSYYDTFQKQIVVQYQLGLIPVLSYRVQF